MAHALARLYTTVLLQNDVSPQIRRHSIGVSGAQEPYLIPNFPSGNVIYCHMLQARVLLSLDGLERREARMPQEKLLPLRSGLAMDPGRPNPNKGDSPITRSVPVCCARKDQLWVIIRGAAYAPP